MGDIELLKEYRQKPCFVGASNEFFKAELESKALNTRYIYTKNLAEYLENNETDTEKLYQKVKSLENGDDRRAVKSFRIELNRYFNDLMLENEYKYNTIETRVKPLNTFFKANELRFRFSFKVNGEFKHDEDIRELLLTDSHPSIQIPEAKRLLNLSGNPKAHSIITMLKDTGLRVGDLPELKVKHVKPVLENPDLMYYTFEIIPNKNLKNRIPLPANPVIGPDACNYLRKWVRYAKRKYGKFKELNDESYIYFKQINELEKTNTDDLSAMISRLVDKDEELKKAGISAHSFRKTHMTKLQAAGMPERWINVMQGRKGEGTQGIYTKPTEKELIEHYKEAYESLSFERVKDLSEMTDRIEELENKYSNLLENYKELAELNQKIISAANSGNLKTHWGPDWEESRKKAQKKLAKNLKEY